MYKQLKRQVEDKKILEEQVRGLEDRIKYKIQHELGLKSTTYAELKIECPNIDDRFARVFSQIEKLDYDLQMLKGELEIIEASLKRIDRLLGEMNDREKKVFRCRYLWGLSVKNTAERLHYSIDRVKQISRDIFQK